MTNQDGGLHETRKKGEGLKGAEAVEREKPLLDIADIEIDAFRRTRPLRRQTWLNLCLVTGRRTMQIAIGSSSHQRCWERSRMPLAPNFTTHAVVNIFSGNAAS